MRLFIIFGEPQRSKRVSSIVGRAHGAVAEILPSCSIPGNPISLPRADSGAEWQNRYKSTGRSIGARSWRRLPAGVERLGPADRPDQKDPHP
jgi:hypothetical protein